MDRETAPARIKLLADPVIEAYKSDVDRTLLRNNLKLTVEQRIRQHRMIAESAAKMRPRVDRRTSRRFLNWKACSKSANRK